MKIYTKGGDQGETGLFSGERVAKCNERIDAYGTIDELNSVLGVSSAALASALPAGQEQVLAELRRIQSELLHVGSWLATTPGASARGRLREITPEMSQALEAAIDRMQADLPPLTGFLLPGGQVGAAWLHVARTVCRRAERCIVKLGSPEDVPVSAILVYVNRLSDFLFVLARHCNRVLGAGDELWSK